MVRRVLSSVLVIIAVGGVSRSAAAQEVQVNAWHPGPYEVHIYVHPSDRNRVPYFATHPPVYLSAPPFARTYGWTPYPYLGSQYQQPNVATGQYIQRVPRETRPAAAPAKEAIRSATARHSRMDLRR